MIEAQSGVADAWLSYLWLEITEKCNLTCDHCYVSSGPHLPLHGRMQTEDWLRAIEQAAALGCRGIQFIGGEPTLHPALDEMIMRAREAGIPFIEVYTNGTALTAKRLQFFARHGVHVAVSFYSVDAQTHDAIVRHKGAHRRTLQGIEATLKKDIPLRIGFVETEKNKGHFEEAKVFLAHLGVPEKHMRFDRARAFGRATEFTATSKTSAFNDMCGQCWKGKLCITASGTAFPCSMGRAHPVGNVLDAGGVEALLLQPQITTFRTAMATEQGRTMPQRTPQGWQLAPEDPAATPETCTPPATPKRDKPFNHEDPIQRCPPANDCNPVLECTPDNDPCEPDFSYCVPGEPKSKHENPSWSERRPPQGRINETGDDNQQQLSE